MKLIIKLLLYVFLVLIVLACTGYYLVFHVIWQEARGEVSRVTSPDGKLDAVHPRVDYNTYIGNLNQCDLHLSCFPFGGAASTIDVKKWQQLQPQIAVY